jgi:hypothetical protein
MHLPWRIAALEEHAPGGRTGPPPLARSAQYPRRDHRLTMTFREDCMETTFNGLDGNGAVREV